MGLIVRDSGGDFEKTPEGTHLAVCCWVVDLGIQDSREYGPKHKVLLCWELNEEKRDGTRYTISKRYTASISEKSTLRKDLESWRGKKFTDEELDGFHLKNIIGKPCQVTVVHTQAANQKTYANVAAVTSIPRGVPAPSLTGPTIYYDQDAPDPEEFAKMPEWLQNIVCEGVERAPESQQEAVTAGVAGGEEDIPF